MAGTPWSLTPTKSRGATPMIVQTVWSTRRRSPSTFRPPNCVCQYAVAEHGDGRAEGDAVVRRDDEAPQRGGHPEEGEVGGARDRHRQLAHRVPVADGHHPGLEGGDVGEGVRPAPEVQVGREGEVAVDPLLAVLQV